MNTFDNCLALLSLGFGLCQLGSKTESSDEFNSKTASRFLGKSGCKSEPKARCRLQYVGFYKRLTHKADWKVHLMKPIAKSNCDFSIW